mmetsp:Transcript_18440/g.34320  ORF Transcript_18440/g.34320 Transcript_18440/m.34320 type:complete len:83 (-) Transcript_18440:642-890(-)
MSKSCSRIQLSSSFTSFKPVMGSSIDMGVDEKVEIVLGVAKRGDLVECGILDGLEDFPKVEVVPVGDGVTTPEQVELHGLLL